MAAGGWASAAGATSGGACGPHIGVLHGGARPRHATIGALGSVRPSVPLPIASAVVLIAVPLVRLGVWHAPRAIQLALAQPGLLSGRRLYL